MFRDALAQLVEALAGERGDLQRVAEAARSRRRASGSSRSTLFRSSSTGSDDAPISCRTESTACSCSTSQSSGCEPSATWRTRSATSVSSSVDGEPFDELMRQAADEADRVGDEVAPAVLLERARRRIERLEEAVLDRDVRVGQRVEQRRLARVRVAGERDRRDRRCAHVPSGASRAGATPRRGARFRIEMRRRASRRSVSSCDSPGPRVPTPAPTCRGRRRAARGASTRRACAAGCTRAARARPGACPRR